ncbi:MAG TPA: 2-amino-4-hydroxy-6-hydroxymethyldihydropteridine diphosphokinase [Thermoanaerobaculia bacterium]|nr:2-amino-4-hydroxy-6-hydroxymethyldihydropteridine diphosphokinase [Thermoanaerobaculia bacterium]
MTTTTSSTRTRKPSRSGRGRRGKKSTDAAPRTAYLGLGSNVGDRRLQIERAVAELSRVARVRRVSSFYSTEPVGFREQRRFWNAAAEIRWDGSPEELLAAVKDIERRLGRTPTFENGPREIDIDILDLGGIARSSPDPVLPHPRLAGRRFALIPLAEIAPSWRHPVSGLSARRLAARLPRKPSVRRVPRTVLPGERSD